MAAQTKDELVEELSASHTKQDLVELLGSKLKKDELASVLDAEDDDATKEQLVRKLASRTKHDLVEALSSKLTKDDLQKAIDSHARKSEQDSSDDDDDRGQERSQRTERRDRSDRSDRGDRTEREQRRRGPEPESDDELDWNVQLDWGPPPRPTPPPVAFRGAPPFMPGQRVRVDLAGLPMMGVFAGKGASAAGTIVGVDARQRAVRIYLDAVFDGEKEVVVPPERVVQDG